MLVGVLFCWSAGMSYAAVTGCAGSSIHTISAAGGETPAGGCGQTDLGFNTFNVTEETGIGTGNGPSTFATGLSTSGGTISGGTTITPINLDFTATYTTGTNHAASAVDETVSYLATPNLGGVAEEPTGAAGHSWAINGIAALTIPAAPTLTGTGIPTGTGTGTADVYLKIIETVCLGQTSLANCAAANEATLTALVTYSGTALNGVQDSASCGSVTATFGCVASGGNLTFNDIFSAVVTNEIILNHPVDTGTGTTTYNLSLAGFDDTFDQMEAPEPSTFILLGSALAGLGALRLRKSRQS